jgi:hypothetical protein
MKTTVDIADPLFERARTIADEEGTTLRALIEEGLQQVLEHRSKRGEFVLRDAHFKGRGRGLAPEFATAGWDKIRGAIYGDPE